MGCDCEPERNGIEGNARVGRDLSVPARLNAVANVKRVWPDGWPISPWFPGLSVVVSRREVLASASTMRFTAVSSIAPGSGIHTQAPGPSSSASAGTDASTDGSCTPAMDEETARQIAHDTLAAFLLGQSYEVTACSLALELRSDGSCCWSARCFVAATAPPEVDYPSLPIELFNFELGFQVWFTVPGSCGGAGGGDGGSGGGGDEGEEREECSFFDLMFAGTKGRCGWTGSLSVDEGGELWDAENQQSPNSSW